MIRPKSNYAATVADRQSSGELLILPDGRILAHNVTPALARLLSEFDPSDAAMRARAAPALPADPAAEKILATAAASPLPEIPPP